MQALFSTYRIKRRFAAILAGLLFSTAALGQNETEPADRSTLAGVRLPSGAQRVNDASVPTEIKQALAKIVAEGGGKIRQGESEVLIWMGDDLANKGANSIVNNVASALKSGGWEYEVSGTEDGVSIFSVLRSEPERRGLLGLFTEADGVLMFAWTEVHAASGASQPSTKPAITSGGGDVSDYSFNTPSGWSRSDANGKITLTSQDGAKSIAFLPMMETTGNLESDVKKIVWQVFKGYEPWADNGFTPDYGTFERGRTSQGLEYFRMYRYAKKVGDNGSVGGSRFDAVILLVKLGNKVAVIAGRSPFQSDYADDSAGSTIDRILYDLKFKSVNTPYDVKSEMLGSWSAASSTVAIAYTFNANGTFNKGGAISFRTRHDDTRDKVTTTSYGMSDKYSVAGNVITQTYRNTGEVVKFKVRLYETRYDKDPWQRKLGLLPIADPESGTIVLKRSE